MKPAPSHIEDLVLAVENLGVEREPEVGVDLFAPPEPVRALVPWVDDSHSPPAHLEPAAPAWIYEIDLPAPPPRPTAPTPAALLHRLRQQTAVDPFEALLQSQPVSANGLAPGAEPTIQELSPLGAGAWWIDPPRPTPVQRRASVEVPVCTPPQWRTARRSAPRPAPPSHSPMPMLADAPPPRRSMFARVAPLLGAAIVCGAIGATLLAGRPSVASTDLVVPPPPAQDVAALPAKIEPEHAPAPAVPSRDLAREKLLKRVRAAKKWSTERWPAPVAAPAPAASPEPQPEPAHASAADELKRPEF